ncbi:hypothetical protein SAMN05421664_3307 [Chryseobacterium soldanellicola]|uniref:Uncharacterized protein n=2 Tax=Chryseobacterium soldanellicola TaxID=311333 RepID=A0A1H1FWI9_9FLAO|nr:hypothetical protein SAMN05421664_3307 [Chryseobacterium soldanellicola]
METQLRTLCVTELVVGDASPEDFINLEIKGNKFSGYTDWGIYYFMNSTLGPNPNYTLIPPSKFCMENQNLKA